MENDTTHTNRPIGYWLRAADRLITREFATAFEDEGVTRREWMILNVLGGTVDAPELAARIQRGGKKLRGLAERGWVTEDDGAWTLTDEGRAAAARLSEVVAGIRAKVAGAVSPEDFATTLASLEAIARELGWNVDGAPLDARGPGRRFRPGFGRRNRDGFGPGFGHGFGPRDGFGPGFGHGEHPHGGHGRPGCADGERHGHHGPGHGHHGHRGHRVVERAYERGFDAGFTRGRQDRSA
jgi:hypothetical protein